MRNDFIQHSAKGTSWKNHKYIRKDGKKYIYKESYTGDSGTTWDVYENPETGETVNKNAGFKYDPERYSTSDAVDDAKSDYGASRYEMYEEEGKSFIADLFKKKDKKLVAKK